MTRLTPRHRQFWLDWLDLLGMRTWCFIQRMQPILHAPAVSRSKLFWPKADQERQRSPRQGAACRRLFSLAGPPCWLVTSLANCMGARLDSTSKNFSTSRIRLIFCPLSTVNNIGQTRGSKKRRGRRSREQAAPQQNKDKPRSCVDHRRPPPASHSSQHSLTHSLLAFFVLPGSSCRSLLPHAPRSCHGALFFSPVTRPGSQEGFAILFHTVAAPLLDLQSTANLPQSKALLLHCVPARRFSLSRRAFIEHHPTAANNSLQ